MNGIVSHVWHICSTCIHWRWLLYQCYFIIRSFCSLPRFLSVSGIKCLFRNWRYFHYVYKTILQYSWEKQINRPGNLKNKKCFFVRKCIWIYSDPTFVRALAFLNLWNTGIEIVAQNSSPSKQLLSSVRADTWKRFENCKMVIYGIVHLEVKYILPSSLVVNFMQMESFYLFFSKIYIKGL